jgi:hypothetical protein
MAYMSCTIGGEGGTMAPHAVRMIVVKVDSSVG